MENKDLLAIEQLIVQGNLGGLSPDQRLVYVKQICDSLGLNHLTNPFQYISLQGKLTLYATKSCTEQLRKIHGVSITALDSQTIQGVYAVKATATDASDRKDFATGAVTIEGLKGDALANALMKAETKAKRRVTLSICGLGVLDETELETIPGTQVLQERKSIQAPVKAEVLNKLDAPLYYQIPGDVLKSINPNFLAKRQVFKDEELDILISHYDLGPRLKEFLIDEKLLPEKSDSLDHEEDITIDSTFEEEKIVEETPLQKAQKRAEKMKR